MDSLSELAWSTDPLDLDAARRDLWPRSTLRMRDGQLPPRPSAVVWPRSAAGVREALERAAGRPVIPYGGGSGVCGGAESRDDAVVIDTKRLNRLISVDPGTRTAHVQAGMLGQHLEDALARRGWMTAHSPSSVMCSTVGGYVAARGAGQFSSRYGVFDDMVLAISAETPAGTVRAGCWTPGRAEDLLPVIAGSEGALGVVTDVLVRVAPLPERRWLRAYAFPSVEVAWDVMRELMQARLWPSVLRLYGPLDTRVGGPERGARKAGQGPGWVKRVGAAVSRGLGGHALALPLSMPRLVNRIAGSLGGEVLLVVGFEGPSQVVQAVVQVARSMLSRGRDLGAKPGEHWFAHRHDVSYKLAPIFAGGGWADTMEVAATWSRLPALWEGVRGALARHVVSMAHFSHAYPEGCSIYFSFAGGGGVDAYDAAWRAGLQAVRRAGGTVTHHHGVGQLKAHEAALEAGAAVRVWRELKDRLDPQGVMNPGRLFPDDVSLPSGPSAPQGGPVFSIDVRSGLAEVDPHAPVAALEASLARHGQALDVRPDRPLAAWLPALRRGVLERWQVPLFAVQARFSDGTSVRLGDAPRSAAGPDLRWGLLRRARAELVQVPVHPIGAPHVVRAAEGLYPDDLRPSWLEGERWGFEGPASSALAELAGRSSASGGAPRKSPTRRPWTPPEAP